MRRPSLPVLLALAALATPVAALAGEIYCNAQGKECSDRPTPGSVAVRTHEAPPTSEPASSRPAPPVDGAANDRLKADAQREAVQKDVASTHADQCKAATDHYQKSIEARRLYRTGKDGEREYLTDAEIDEARLAAKRQMDEACSK